jgi:alpha-beta hydrolase superfamily lysophospholipase
MRQFSERCEYTEVNGGQIATVLHDGGSKKIVLFCHGYISSKIGPRRFFVRVARQLQKQGVCALRFDQRGCGDSEGDFYESSFNDWIETTKTLAQRYHHEGYQVGLLGQSMGGATVLAASGDLGPIISSVVAWVPDPSVDNLEDEGVFIEEEGQRVQRRYWEEAHDANIVGRFQKITAPTLVLFATADAYVSEENRQAIIDVRREHQQIELLEGWPHSAWTYDQATHVIDRTVSFFVSNFA